MKKYVFTVDEAVCQANGKDVNAVDLLQVMQKFGAVEDYEAHIGIVKRESQRVIDDLTVQYDAIKEQKLTADEIELVRCYRQGKEICVKGYIDENDALKNQLKNAKLQNEKIAEEICKVLASAKAEN